MSATNHHAGLAAEDIVIRHYDLPVAARRWKGPGGEIDLILRDGARVIFVEVKAGRNAALALQPRQIARIRNSALAWLGDEPLGQRTECRFDVALVVDGRVEVIANVQ
ncbi:YraN family protein [Falsirhodobacter sp. 20TX0035]|uniref:YraN family protein n=1 Tax=Falsirhodobacter sp. 20TX0035 TaxID=3022019 RepID=UPI00232C4F3E|nr:YraN family protein [Falsirhodobacter sp. 20TX0035]MDB6453854.1 YraN family protein [Falsirhodobacter sp. 20TX0035]